jgi:ribulose-phosphate 3-epimerase
VDIEVDGGIDPTTAPLVVGAGATVLVAGTNLFRNSRGLAVGMSELRAAADGTQRKLGA